jgi:hypothetical protein
MKASPTVRRFQRESVSRDRTEAGEVGSIRGHVSAEESVTPRQLVVI